VAAALLHRPSDPDLPIVVKMAPPGLTPVRNRDVLRQARILRALGAAEGVPVGSSCKRSRSISAP